MTPRHHVASSPALMEHAKAFNRSNSSKRICVVRRAGSDVDQQISSVVASACRAVGRDPSTDAFSTTHFLAVDHHCAGKLLDRVRRQGLPLIFLNGDCVGGFAELKRLMSNGFLAESLCAHDFGLVVIGCGEGNAVAERAVEEAVKFGKRVALVEVKQQNGRGRNAFVDEQIAKEMANRAALMRHSIEEAQLKGWTVECSEGGRVNFWLDWRCVREAIVQKTLLKRQRTEAAFERGQVQLFSVTACHFSGTHELTVCQMDTDTNLAQSKLAKICADKFLLVPKSESKVLENVPGAKEFCISNEELFALKHNPGRTLFFCEDDADPQLLESAAILKALGNDVTIMTNTYSPRRIKPSKLDCFDSEFILSIKDKLCQLGIRFFISLPTKFEQLRASTDDKSAILRVYATSAWSKPAEKGGAGDWAPFLEEFNTVVISVGRRSHSAEELVLANVQSRNSNVNCSPTTDSTAGCASISSRKLSSSELLLAPNVYAIGDVRLEQRWTGGTSPPAQSEEGNCRRVRMLVRRMCEANVETMENDTPMVRTMLIPPTEYAGCGLNEEETERKFGRHLMHVYRDGHVPIAAEKAKMICVKECVVGLHLIGPNASQLLNGYALAMKLGLTKKQMEQNDW
uniref:Pyridine nucleotide-disulphide oxidoreductase dimerisation domain-containing protein n=1 Tax=Globodera rostochiensis TaxID=31243 RepID=A0A914IDI5_GLORO